MKTLIFILILLTSTSLYSREDNGWSSSGGGDLPTDIYNPWFWEDFFHQDAPKTWCMIHGGKKNFSLSEKESKETIEKAIKMITDSLKKQWPIPEMIVHIKGFYDLSVSGFNSYNLLVLGQTLEIDFIRRLYYDADYNELQKYIGNPLYGKTHPVILKKLATRFQFQEKCTDKTDLKFLLGVDSGKIFDKLLKTYPRLKRRTTVGLAIRTFFKTPNYNDYNDDGWGGRGFIWITPDLGNFSYQGPTSHLDSTSPEKRIIWNKKINDTNIFNSKEIQVEGLKNDITAKDLLERPLLPVLLHEIAHAFGFRHHKKELPIIDDRPIEQMLGGHNLDLMDEEFPALAVTIGAISKRVIANSLTLFSGIQYQNSERTERLYHFGYTGKNENRFKHAFKLEFDGRIGASNIGSYQDETTVRYCGGGSGDHCFPNKVILDDKELELFLERAYAIEFEYGFGEFNGQEYPSKMRLVQQKDDIFLMIPSRDRNIQSKFNDYSLRYIQEINLTNVEFNSEYSFSDIPFVFSSKNPVTLEIDYVHDHDFRTHYKRQMIFNFQLSSGTPYLGLLTDKELRLINLNSGVHSSILNAEDLYFLSGKELDSIKLPDHYYRKL